MLGARQHSLIAAAVLLLVMFLVAASPISGRLFERLDLVLFDLLLPVQSPPMSDAITVVAIDNRSIDELGRWPWSRHRHAELIEQLTAMGARVVGVDVLFAEPQERDEDADLHLADAIGKGVVVLPVAPTKQLGSSLISEILPIPDLARRSAALGHVDVELDSDGLCRSTFLYGGVGGARWPSLALAMHRTADPEAAVAAPDSLMVGSPVADAWLRSGRRLIPFTHPGAGPRVVSFSDVLDGRVANEDIAGRYVLVGATAAGLGDAVSTPGAFSHERMPGVLLNAQILNGLLQDSMLTEFSNSDRIALSLLLVFTTVLAIVISPAQFAPVAAVLGVAAVLAAAAYFLAAEGLWFAPASTLIAVLAAWPAWTAWQYQRADRLTSRLLRELNHQASHDAATGLPNHRMLVDRLRQFAASPANQGVAALMVMHIHWPGSASIALDRPINPTIMRVIRDRLKEITREGDFVAHLSSDDFAILTPGFNDAQGARDAATAFLEKMQIPLEYKEEHLLLSPEIGVSMWPDDATEPTELLRNAYTAMFKSRIEESESLCIYSGSVSDELETRSRMEQALVHALARHEFSIHYQPQISARTMRIVGVEALLRWNHPLLGWVSPAAFVPVAEHVGLIKAIGAWVIEHACRQLKDWNKLGFPEMRMAINVSPLQFLVPGLEDDIQEIVGRIGIKPGYVELEITESSMMRDIDNAVRIMNKIKDFGLELAIDDFGTGYSSLSNLRHFPLDRLKIDQAFTREIGKSGNAERITVTIMAMARHLGLRVIAEGVETEAQAKFLRDQGCDELQGFLYGKPMPAKELTARLEAERER